MKVRTRIAPSPTGDPHVGTAYIALFNLIFARHHGGDFILRIEDTDQKRSKKEYEENIFKALSWCKINWDEGPDIGGPYGPYRQSERTKIYQEYAQKLLDAGNAYKCFATPEELQEMREISAKKGTKVGYDRRYRNLSKDEIQKRIDQNQSYVIRLKVPLTGECTYNDAVKGRISCPWSDVDDQVIIKSDGTPTYHLASVVDDHLMKITHVIRGDEWMSSTPKHVLLYQYLRFDIPVFMHMPLLLGKDGKKLSKRKNPTSIFYYKDSGYLPEALINFLTLLGYSYESETEFYSLDDIIASFKTNSIGVSGAYFDIQKLNWLNQKYIINSISENDLLSRLKKWSLNDEFMQKLMPLVHTRIKTFSDFIALCDFFFINELNYSIEKLCPKNTTPQFVAYVIQSFIWCLEEMEAWDGTAFEKASKEVAKTFDINHKKILMPILFSTIMGKRFGPPLYDSVTILGKERTRARLLNAIEFLGGISQKKIFTLRKNWEEKDCINLKEVNHL
jgi:glutamyl-tRNA synthetase